MTSQSGKSWQRLQSRVIHIHFIHMTTFSLFNGSLVQERHIKRITWTKIRRKNQGFFGVWLLTTSPTPIDTSTNNTFIMVTGCLYVLKIIIPVNTEENFVSRNVCYCYTNVFISLKICLDIIICSYDWKSF